jgi:hypothetical protein
VKKAVGESDHKKGMALLKEVVGSYPDGPAQGKALKFMLAEGLTLQQIEKGLRDQFAEYNAKGFRCTYLTLQKTIFQSIQQPAISDNGFVQVDLPFALMIEVGFMGVPEDDWMNRYQIYRDDWLVTKPDRAIEVADYERSADFAEKSGRKGSGKNGGIVALNGRDGQASPQVPLSR